MNEYLYQLRPARPAMLAEGLTTQEVQIREEHSSYLEELARRGVMILYGRTQNNDESTFGIVIFEAASDAEARGIMEHDPAVLRGMMRATLYPYKVAYLRSR